MVVQNYKSKHSLESDMFLNVTTETETETKTNTYTDMMSNRNWKTVKCDMLCKSVVGTLILSLFILNITFLFLVINKNSSINRLHDQVNALNRDVDMLKYRFFDDNLLKEIAEFERESYADEPESQPDESDDFDKNDEDFVDYEVEPQGRAKREVLTATATLDGVPIITESYAEQKRRNATATASEGLRLYESLGKNTPAPAPAPVHKRTFQTGGWAPRTYVNHGRSASVPIVSRTSRVMHTNEDKSKAFRKVVKKSLLKSSPSNLQEHVESAHVTMLPPSPSGTPPAGRRTGHGHRHGKKRRSGASLVETAEVVGAHYYGNTSHLVAGKHHGYRGNGHLAHPQGLYVDWQPSDWVATSALQLHQGEVVVREPGLYLVYAQIYYVDEHDLNGFKIMRNSVELAQCTTMTHTERKLDKRNTCWTAMLTALEDGDRVCVRDIETHRYALLAHAKSFFGLYKLADLNLNHRHASTHTIK